MRSKKDDINLLQKTYNKIKTKNLLVTRGKNGAFLINNKIINL